MTVPPFVADALEVMAECFTPFRRALADATAFREFLAEFGWKLDEAVDDSNFGGIQQIFAPEIALLDAIANGSREQLAIAVPALATALRAVRGPPNPGLPAPLGSADLWTNTPRGPAFPRELLDTLIYVWFAQRVPIAFALLRFIGALQEDYQAARPPQDGSPARAEYSRRTVDWNRLGPAVANPAGIFADLYGWGGPAGTFDHERLVRGVAALFEGLPLGVAVTPASDAAYGLYFDQDPTSPPTVSQLTVVPLGYSSPAGLTFGRGKITLNVLPIPASGSRIGPAEGFAIFPLITGDVQANLDLADHVRLTLRGDLAATPMFVECRPLGGALRIIGPAAAAIDAELRVDVDANEEPWTVIGSSTSTRVEVSRAHAALRAQGTVAAPALTIEVGIDQAALVVDFGEGDSFLRSVFGDQKQRLDLSTSITWSNRTGLRFGGDAHLEITIPSHASLLGAIDLESITISLSGGDSGRITLGAGLTGRVTLGPVIASVDRVGLRSVFIPADGGDGKLGIFDFLVEFGPPTGIGIVIDAGPITGGGYLAIDTPNGRYAGVLQLQLFGIGVDAIGLLDTRLPGGRPGYSFLILIAATLPPIQLGFGFILDGIGGLCGIHRTMVVQAIQDGVRNHALDSILFPQDPVGNASQIIASLSMIFPPTEGHHIFGPMARIGWGTPPLISAEIAFLLELPGPRIAILGQVSMVLPSEDAALIEFHLDVTAVLDAPGKRISLDASLHDSRVALFCVYGDIAFRLSWGDNPNFALSVGGLNPHFQPPPGFPTLRRIGVSLGFDDNPRISVQGYFALTSNSLQFGALAELYAAAWEVNIYGWIGFDALFIFVPFSFRIDFTCGFELRWGDDSFAGVSLSGMLSGVAPWHIAGEACISILFFDISVSFDVRFGEERREIPPSVDPWPILHEAIIDPLSWSATLPPAATRAVSIASPSNDSAQPTLAEPMGGLTLRERVLPFDRRITKFGEATLAGADEYRISAVSVGDHAAPYTPVEDYFARAQYAELSDAERVSSPSYEPMHAGLTLGDDALEIGPSLERTLEYETRLIDSPWDGRPAPSYVPTTTQQLSMIAAGAVARAPAHVIGVERYAPGVTGAVIALIDGLYVIANTEDLTLRADLGPARQKGAAMEDLARYLLDHPEERGNLQVVSAHEAQAS